MATSTETISVVHLPIGDEPCTFDAASGLRWIAHEAADFGQLAESVAREAGGDDELVRDAASILASDVTALVSACARIAEAGSGSVRVVRGCANTADAADQLAQLGALVVAAVALSSRGYGGGPWQDGAAALGAELRRRLGELARAAEEPLGEVRLGVARRAAEAAD